MIIWHQNAELQFHIIFSVLCLTRWADTFNRLKELNSSCTLYSLYTVIITNHLLAKMPITAPKT